MKAKAKRSLKHLETKGIAKWAIEALRDYHGLCEELITEAHEDAMKERRMGEKRRKIMEMLGIIISPTLTDETVNFLYSNVKELREEKGHIPLMEALFKLQIELDDIDFWCELLKCVKQPILTAKDVKEQREKLKKKHLDYKVKGYKVDDYNVPKL